MSNVSLDKFLALAARSGLVEPGRLTEVTDDWKNGPSLAQTDGAQSCAEHFVRSGVLTAWQAHKLLEGRHRGFFLGKYKLLDHLGSGGMSSVYLAEHTLMQRLVAIKVLPQHRVSDSSYLARFLHEGQCAAALDHPNIVRVYDLDNRGKIHYLVMEYIDGRDLQQVVANDGRLEAHLAADYTAQAAAGLEHAHAAGLVHRDIKPANLLLDHYGNVKILDMGLSKLEVAEGLGAQLVQEDQVLGTADYLAPEQVIDSNAVDCRADIYSLGCTLYFLLAGQPPFAYGSPLQRMAAHRRQSPPSIVSQRRDVPQALAAICNRMMAKSLDDRFQTAASVRDALEAWLAEESAAGRFAKRSDTAADDRAGEAALGGPAHPQHAGHQPPPQTAPRSPQDNVGQGGTEDVSTQPLATTDDASHQLASQSHVLHPELVRLSGLEGEQGASTVPLPPPISIPPAPTPPVAAPAAQPVPFGTSPTTGTVAVASGDPPFVPRPSRAIPGRRVSTRWPSVFVLTGLILTALLLAIFVLAG